MKIILIIKIITIGISIIQIFVKLEQRLAEGE